MGVDELLKNGNIREYDSIRLEHGVSPRGFPSLWSALHMTGRAMFQLAITDERDQHGTGKFMGERAPERLWPGLGATTIGVKAYPMVKMCRKRLRAS